MFKKCTENEAVKVHVVVASCNVVVGYQRFGEACGLHTIKMEAVFSAETSLRVIITQLNQIKEG
jgi:hypothetical protein